MQRQRHSTLTQLTRDNVNGLAMQSVLQAALDEKSEATAGSTSP